MASIFPVYFYINTDIRAVVSARGNSSTVASTTLRRGDQLPMRILFANTTGTTQTISAGDTITFSARVDKDWNGYTVLSVTTFSSIDEHYLATLDLSGTTLSNLFVPKNTSQVTLQSEIAWTHATQGTTYQYRTQPFKLIVQNEVTQ